MTASASRLAGLFAGVLGCTAFAADPPAKDSPFFKPATVMEVGTAYLSSQLAQMAYSEYDALQDRRMGTRFIPHQIAAYYLPEPSGRNIHIVATWRHTEKDRPKQELDEICQGMLRWVRFHLGIKDNGKPIAHASEYGTSTLYQFIGPSDGDPSSYTEQTALELDRQTILIGDIGYVGSGAGRTALCKMNLTEP